MSTETTSHSCEDPCTLSRDWEHQQQDASLWHPTTPPTFCGTQKPEEVQAQASPIGPWSPRHLEFGSDSSRTWSVDAVCPFRTWGINGLRSWWLFEMMHCNKIYMNFLHSRILNLLYDVCLVDALVDQTAFRENFVIISRSSLRSTCTRSSSKSCCTVKNHWGTKVAVWHQPIKDVDPWTNARPTVVGLWQFLWLVALRRPLSARAFLNQP